MSQLVCTSCWRQSATGNCSNCWYIRYILIASIIGWFRIKSTKFQKLPQLN